MAFINLLQAVYPVGAVYVSTVNTSPSSLIGGTWTQITNAALRASTSVGYTGADTHAITINEMPSHQHISSGCWDWMCSQGFNSGGYNIDYVSSGGNATALSNYSTIIQGGGKQCRLSNVLTTALFGTELRRFFGGDVNGIY